MASALSFHEQFRGGFTSLLSWSALAEFWDRVRVRADAGWYVYAIGEPPPTQPRSAAEIHKFLREIDALLRADHDEDYCGIVYTDNKLDPTFIKIFDPNNLGVSCGSSKNPPLPGWIMSLTPPQALESPRVVPERRRRWWTTLWAS